MRTATTSLPARTRTGELVTASLVAALMAATSWISLSFGPVPFTLQTAFVMLGGALLGPSGAFSAMAVYLVLGAVGLPVFARGEAGIGALVGPTGGFLLAFPLAALAFSAACSLIGGSVVGRRRVVGMIAGALVAEVVIYSMGVPWLMAQTGLSVGEAASVAVVPFLVPDVVKASIAILVALAVQRSREA